LDHRQHQHPAHGAAWRLGAPLGACFGPSALPRPLLQCLRAHADVNHSRTSERHFLCIVTSTRGQVHVQPTLYNHNCLHIYKAMHQRRPYATAPVRYTPLARQPAPAHRSTWPPRLTCTCTPVLYWLSVWCQGDASW
jgi:hypothetical protein